MVVNTNIDEVLEHLWCEIRGDRVGEPNLLDFKLMAQTLRLHYVDEMLQELPGCETGLKIVEYIEDNIFKDAATYEIYHVVRNLTLEDFSKRMREIAKRLQLNGYLHGGVTKALSAAFYAWYGCLSMAKLTRVEGSDGVLYTTEMRLEEYKCIRNEWEDAEKYGNLWIKFGVRIAKLLEEKRKKAESNKVIVDDWVPEDSPYWECFKKS